MIQRDVVAVSRLNISSSVTGVGDGAESHVAYAIPDSDAGENTLWDAYQWRDEVTVRCAAIEVRGMISNVRYDGLDKVYEMSVDHVAHRRHRVKSRQR
ncbi:MAG: hypothetical protein JXR25_13605 [Pontiellaceae bacterium]|nr:hypothetical protein [Pontiellaceae bacterium]MBN2785852.1 hypothetical protein [Pontiellaceae bacterium]